MQCLMPLLPSSCPGLCYSPALSPPSSLHLDHASTVWTSCASSSSKSAHSGAFLWSAGRLAPAPLPGSAEMSPPPRTFLDHLSNGSPLPQLFSILFPSFSSEHLATTRNYLAYLHVCLLIVFFSCWTGLCARAKTVSIIFVVVSSEAAVHPEALTAEMKEYLVSSQLALPGQLHSTFIACQVAFCSENMTLPFLSCTCFSWITANHSLNWIRGQVARAVLGNDFIKSEKLWFLRVLLI